MLRERSPKTRIIVCEPDNSQVLGSGIPQPRTADGTPSGSHPAFHPHPMQGWGPDFIPKLADDAVAMKLIDRIVPINGDDALRCSRELARQEGIFVGITSGATFAGALEVGRSAPAGSTVLCMLPDTGERYLSTPLFADVPADMTDQELEISRSTPSARFDVAAAAPSPTPAPAPAPAPTVSQPVEADATEFVARAIGDPNHPVVMFALEWCEFCWAVRNMFAHYGIAYRSVDLDSVEYQRDDRGGKIRAALSSRTGVVTIPQVFVGGELIGGASETLEAMKQGRLQQLLERSGVTYDRQAQTDPQSFLPGWLQRR